MKTEEDRRPWYRQFWLWVVLAPLITVVCVSTVMVSIAFYHADDVVIDNYYKQGRMINQVMEQDRRARELNLSAQLRFDQITGEVLVKIPGDAEVPDKLLLTIDHPFEADLDQQVILQLVSAGHYRGELATSLEHSWYLSLLPELDQRKRKEAEWILSGQINFSLAESTELSPRELL